MVSQDGTTVLYILVSQPPLSGVVFSRLGVCPILAFEAQFVVFTCSQDDTTCIIHSLYTTAVMYACPGGE